MPQREAAHGCQVQAEQQEVGKWGVGNLVGGEGGSRGVQEQIHELCLFTLELPKTSVKKPQFLKVVPTLIYDL